MNFDNIPTIKSNHTGPLQIGPRLDSIDQIMSLLKYIQGPQNWVQFGVASGHSARHIQKFMGSNDRLFLLDSFEGLPENWGSNPNQKKGAFKLRPDQIPKFSDPRITIIKGWFKDTVKELNKICQSLNFIHIDCDIYSSTVKALQGVGLFMTDPCYILFDEFYNYPEYEDHEYKAFFEFIEAWGFKYKPLFKTAGSQVAFKVWEE